MILDSPKLTIQPHNVTIIEGYEVALKCSGIGYPIFNVTWYRDNQLITSHFTNYSDASNQNRTGNLIITAINATDSGMYTCILTNALGSATSMASWINVQCKYLSTFINRIKFIVLISMISATNKLMNVLHDLSLSVSFILQHIKKINCLKLNYIPDSFIYLE